MALELIRGSYAMIQLGRPFGILVVAALTAQTTAYSQRIVDPKRAPNSQAAGLTEIVKQEQKKNVRESFGEKASECFTDVNLKAFHDSNTVSGIVRRLRRDPAFLAVVDKIRTLSEGQRTDVLASAESTYKPTWAELGRIDRLGQTDAGQAAEKEIAQGIVALAKEILNQSKGN
jgi:hypothetical protein